MICWPSRRAALCLLRVTVVPCLLLLPHPAMAVLEYAKWRPVGAIDWGAQENPDIGINHAVILFDGHLIDDSDRSQRSVYSHYRRVRVFDASGVDAFRSVEISYRKPWKITRIMARTLKPSGEVIEVTDDDIHEKTLLRVGKYRLRAKVFAFKGVEQGDIVEFAYTMRREGLAPPLVQLQTRTYSVETSLRWIYYPQPYAEDFIDASSQDLDYLTYRSAYIVPNGRTAGARLTAIGSASSPEGIEVLLQNLPGIPEEPYMPADEAVAVIFAGHYEFPRLEAKQSYWERVSEAWGKSTREFMERQDLLDSWMREITDRPRDLDGDLSACVEKVQREIRNADILDDDELPRKLPDSESIDELITNGIGSGEQVDILVTAMMKKLGYQATLFWARDTDEGPFIPEWKSADQFTIAGVAVRRDANQIQFCVPHLVAVGSTSIPWEICGSKALMEDISDERSFSDFPPLCDIPMATDDANRVDLDVVLSEGEEGRLQGHMTARWACANESFLQQSLSNEARKSRKAALARLKEIVLRPAIRWTAYEESLAIGKGGFAYSCSLQVEGLVEQAAGMSLIDLGAIRMDDYALPGLLRRTNLDFHYPQHYVSRVDLILAPDRDAPDLPPPAQIVDRLAEFRSDCVAENGRIRLHRDLQIHHGLFLPTAADPLRGIFQKIVKAHEQPIIVRRRDGQ